MESAGTTAHQQTQGSARSKSEGWVAQADQRDFLRDQDRVPMAAITQGVRPVAHGVFHLLTVAATRYLGGDPGGIAR